MENKAYSSDKVDQYGVAVQAPYTLPEPVKVDLTNINDLEKGIVNPTISNGQWGNFDSLSDKVQRIKFIRKVYLIISAQLIFTFGIVAIFVLTPAVKEFSKTPTALYLYLASYLCFFIFICFTLCDCCNALRRVPYNYFLLGGITVTMTYMLAMISCFHEIQAVFIAIGITLFITLGVTAFAMQTKYDFTQNYTLFLVFGIYALIGFGFACLFSYRYIPIMQAVYGGLGALLMSVFLAYDTQALLGNKRFKYNPEDYVNAALQIYLDICYIFLYILQMLGAKK